jgi:hypothetical protein
LRRITIYKAVADETSVPRILENGAYGSRRRLVVIIVVFFAVAFVFLFAFLLGWLLSKEDIGSYRPIRRV